MCDRNRDREEFGASSSDGKPPSIHALNNAISARVNGGYGGGGMFWDVTGVPGSPQDLVVDHGRVGLEVVEAR